MFILPNNLRDVLVERFGDERGAVDVLPVEVGGHVGSLDVGVGEWQREVFQAVVPGEVHQLTEPLHHTLRCLLGLLCHALLVTVQWGSSVQGESSTGGVQGAMTWRSKVPGARVRCHTERAIGCECDGDEWCPLGGKSGRRRAEPESAGGALAPREAAMAYGVRTRR